MRKSSQILIYIDVQKALDAGLKFYLSENGVVLSEGDERGFIPPAYFKRVVNASGVALPGWEGPKADIHKVLVEDLPPVAVDDLADMEASVEGAPASDVVASATDQPSGEEPSELVDQVRKLEVN